MVLLLVDGCVHFFCGLIFCLSTCCVHLDESAVECEFFVGRGILRYLSG